MKQILLFISLLLLINISGVCQDTIAKDTVVNIEEEDPGFWIAEQPASFQGGDINKFSYWVGNNLIYPKEAAEKNISGKLIVQFSVNRQGDVCDIKILRGLHPSLDQAAMECIRKSPKWQPATQGGINVKQNFCIPINFALNIKQNTKKK